MAPPRERSRGLSLVETMISLAVFLIVLLALYTLFDSSNAVYQSGRRKTNVQQNARTAMEELSTRIRMAGYFGENFIPGTPPTAVNGVRLATGTQLAIFGTFEGPPPSQLYFFCWRNADRTLRMRQGNPGDAGTYACDGDAEVLARNVVNFLFTYIDDDNAPITSPLDDISTVPPDLTDTTERSAVRAIRIMMQTQEDVQNANQAPQILTLTTTIVLRNVLLNS